MEGWMDGRGHTSQDLFYGAVQSENHATRRNDACFSFCFLSANKVGEGIDSYICCTDQHVDLSQEINHPL